MAMGQYEIWLCHWDGTRLALLDSFLSLEYTRALHNVGAIDLIVPSTFNDSYLIKDYKIMVLRTAPSQSKRIEGVYLIRKWRRYTDNDNTNYTQISGVCGNDIMKRRIVWAQPGTAEARKTDNACDLIKKYTRQALAETDCYGLPSSVRRGYIATYFTVQADNGQGASFTKNYEGKVLFDVANGIAGTSEGRNGVPVWWYVYPVSASMYQLRTYLNLMGQDLSSRITLTPDFAMANGSHEWDGTDEFNMVVGAGGPIGYGTYPDYRKMEYAYNRSSIYDSPFAWREKFLDLGNEEDYDEIANSCYEDVMDADNLAREIFDCDLIELDVFRYGRDWDLGDKVGLNYRGLSMDAVVKTVHVKVDKTERVRVYFKIDQALDIQTS